MTFGYILCALLIAVVLCGIIYRRKVLSKTYNEFTEPENSFTLLVDQSEPKRILKGIIVNTGSLEGIFTPEDFNSSVAQIHLDEKEIKILSAQPCDIDGNEEKDLRYVSHIKFSTEDTELMAFEKSECPLSVSIKKLSDKKFTYFDTVILAD